MSPFSAAPSLFSSSRIESGALLDAFLWSSNTRGVRRSCPCVCHGVWTTETTTPTTTAEGFPGSRCFCNSHSVLSTQYLNIELPHILRPLRCHTLSSSSHCPSSFDMRSRIPLHPSTCGPTSASPSPIHTVPPYTARSLDKRGFGSFFAGKMGLESCRTTNMCCFPTPGGRWHWTASERMDFASTQSVES